MNTFVQYDIGVGLDIVNKLSDFFTLYPQVVFRKKEMRECCNGNTLDDLVILGNTLFL